MLIEFFNIMTLLKQRKMTRKQYYLVEGEKFYLERALKSICFVNILHQLPSFDPIQAPNNETNPESFRIIFVIRIICPSLKLG